MNMKNLFIVVVMSITCCLYSNATGNSKIDNKDNLGVITVINETIKSNIELSKKDGKTDLMKAASLGDKDLVNAPLKNNNVNETDQNGWSALTYAIDKGHNEIVDILLNEKDIDVNSKKIAYKFSTMPYETKTTNLIIASYKGYTYIVEQLLKHGADKDFIGEDEKDATALMMAAWGVSSTSSNLVVHKDTVQLLLDRGADPNIYRNNQNTFFTILYDGSKGDFLNFLEFAKPDAVAYVLYKATVHKDKKVVQELLSRFGDSKELKFWAKHSLTYAVGKRGYDKVVKQILKQYPDYYDLDFVKEVYPKRI